MTVLQFRPHPRAPAPLGGPASGSIGRPRVPIHGTFTSPNLATGSMDGWLRVLHCSVQGASLRCVAVVSGTLYDARGQRLGLASTRCLLPVTLEPDQRPPERTRSPASLLVGPLEVNLLGFQVRVGQVRLPGPSVADSLPHRPGSVTPLTTRQRA